MTDGLNDNTAAAVRAGKAASAMLPIEQARILGALKVSFETAGFAATMLMMSAALKLFAQWIIARGGDVPDAVKDLAARDLGRADGGQA